MLLVKLLEAVSRPPLVLVGGEVLTEPAAREYVRRTSEELIQGRDHEHVCSTVHRAREVLHKL